MIKSKSTAIMMTVATVLNGTICIVFCDVVGHSIKRRKGKEGEIKRIRGSKRLINN
jgi:hypothetical protein